MQSLSLENMALACTYLVMGQSFAVWVLCDFSLQKTRADTVLREGSPLPMVKLLHDPTVLSFIGGMAHFPRSIQRLVS